MLDEVQGSEGLPFLRCDAPGHTRSEGGGVNRAPQIWGGGGAWEKGSIDRHHKSVIMNTGAKGAEIFF